MSTLLLGAYFVGHTLIKAYKVMVKKSCILQFT